MDSRSSNINFVLQLGLNQNWVHRIECPWITETKKQLVTSNLSTIPIITPTRDSHKHKQRTACEVQIPLKGAGTAVTQRQPLKPAEPLNH
jgi:hypothetical protein